MSITLPDSGQSASDDLFALYTNPYSSSISPASTTDKIEAASTKLMWNEPLPQEERLYTARPRSISIGGTSQGYGGDRGDRAYIRLMTSSTNDAVKSRSISHASSSGKADALITENKYGGYADFLLTGISCNLEEKIQVTQVFGDAEVIYSFGRRPMAFNFSGLLVDSVDNNWFIHWLEMYRDTMNSTQLAKRYELLKIVLPTMTLVGTMTNFSWQQESSNDVAIPFSFQFLAKRMEPTPAELTSAYFPEAISVLRFEAGTSPTLTQSTIEEIKRRSADVSKALQDPNTTSADLARLALLQGKSIPTIGLDGKAGYSSKGGLGSVPSGITDTFSSWSSNLAGVRTSLFSPVFGVLSSLTRLVKVGTGTVDGLVNVFSTGVNDVLRDINSISYAANNLVNMVNTTVNGAAMQVANVRINLRNTIASLERTRGAISNAPSTIHDSLNGLINAGKLNNSPFLLGNVGHPSSQPMLTSILRARETSGVTLPLNAGKPMSIMIALNAGTPRARERAPTL